MWSPIFFIHAQIYLQEPIHPIHRVQKTHLKKFNETDVTRSVLNFNAFMNFLPRHNSFFFFLVSKSLAGRKIGKAILGDAGGRKCHLKPDRILKIAFRGERKKYSQTNYEGCQMQNQWQNVITHREVNQKWLDTRPEIVVASCRTHSTAQRTIEDTADQKCKNLKAGNECSLNFICNAYISI